MVLGDIINHFDEEHDIWIDMINMGNKIVYSEFISEKESSRRLDMKVSDIYKELYNKEPQFPIYLTLTSTEMDIPVCSIVQ